MLGCVLTAVVFVMLFSNQVYALSDYNTQLYVNSYDSTYTQWSVVSSSPYLDDGTSSLITSFSAGAKMGWFSFPDMSSKASEIVYAYLATYSIDNNEISGGATVTLSDGSSWHNHTIGFTGTSEWEWHYEDVTSFLNTPAKVNAAKIMATKSSGYGQGTISIAAAALLVYYNCEITTDDNIEEGFTHWGESCWDINEVTWDYNEANHYMNMTVSVSGFYHWGGVGIMQGTKPYGWGHAPWYNGTGMPYYLVDDDNPMMFSWRGYKYPSTGVAFDNLGVDFWFEIHYGSNTYIGEVYVFMYSYGFGMPVLGANRTQWGQTGQVYNMWHYAQMAENEWYESSTIHIEQSVQDMKNWVYEMYHDDIGYDTYYKPYVEGSYYMIDADAHHEIASGFYTTGTGVYILDSLRVWTDP